MSQIYQMPKIERKEFDLEKFIGSPNNVNKIKSLIDVKVFDMTLARKLTHDVIDNEHNLYMSLLGYNSGNCFYNLNLSHGIEMNKTDQMDYDNIINQK